ncbi:MAG: sigma-70 family RNA polymerase sigma factor [bacterium]
MKEEELVRAARAGDDDAFKEIVRRHEPTVARTVIGMLGDCPEAEDVGQETFIRFYRALPEFRGEANVATYLTRIAINLSLNELKRRRRAAGRLSPKPVEEYGEIADPRQDASAALERDRVRRALAELDEKSRSVIVLRLMDGYSTAETAEILKVPVGTVLSRLARAQMKLKDLLTAQMGAQT